MTAPAPRPRAGWLTAVKWIAITILGVLVVRSFARQWDELRAMTFEVTLRPAWVLLSLVATWVMYAGLVTAWRALLVSWGGRLSWATAGKLWILASFGKYFPVGGKVLSLAGLGVMSEREGVRATTAIGGSIMMQLLSIPTGIVVAALALGPAIRDTQPGLAPGMAVVGVLALVPVALMRHTRFLAWCWRVARLPGDPPPQLSWPVLLSALALNALAWCGYGLAYWALAKGILPEPNLGYLMATGAFAMAYLAGFLSPFAPGGLGVRDVLLVALLEGQLGYGGAVVLTVASRFAHTINELGAAVPALLYHRNANRDDAPPV